MSSSRYSSQAHQRDYRTQLFDYSAHSTPSNSARSTPSLQEQHAQFNNPYGGNTHQNVSSEEVMSKLESQNDDAMEGLSQKIKTLKEVTLKIGDEIRDSNKFLGGLENNFDNARLKLKNTFTRMMVMHQRSGISWKTWLLVFSLVAFVFFYVRFF